MQDTLFSSGAHVITCIKHTVPFFFQSLMCIMNCLLNEVNVHLLSVEKLNLKKDFFCIFSSWVLGRGVFAKVSFMEGNFLLQYAGKLIPGDEGDKLEEEWPSGLRFFLTFKGKEYW